MINNHWSADLGFRYERVRSEATGGIVGVDTDTFVPRLAAAYDVQGNGKHVFHVTYGHYCGPVQRGADRRQQQRRQPGPDCSASTRVRPDRAAASRRASTRRTTRPSSGQFPTANVFFEDGLSSPIVKEFTVSYGADLMNGRGYAEGKLHLPQTSTHHRRLHRHSTTASRPSSSERVRRRHVHQHHLPEHRHRASGSTTGCCSRAATTSRTALDAERPLHAAVEERRQLRGRGGEPAGRHRAASATTRRSSTPTALPRWAPGRLPAPQARLWSDLQPRAWAASATLRCPGSGASIPARVQPRRARSADH